MNDSKNKGMIFNIQRNSFVDGPGIRTTVFFKGCNLKCKWCHNPESQNMNKEIMFYRNKCSGCGRCKNLTMDDEEFFCFNDAKEICGKEYTVDEVMKEVIKDKSFYKASDGGVTFSGGECMLQIEFLTELLKECKSQGINAAVDTAGNVHWENFKNILPYTNIFLYDVKCIDEELHKKGTGVSNKLILENLKKLSELSSVDIIIRIPVIPGFNNSPEEMQRIADFLKNIRYKDIELLPYHEMGKHKHDALGVSFCPFSIPEDSDIGMYKDLLNIG